MRFLPALLLAACTGQSGEEPALVTRCDVVSDTEIAATAAPFGFAATDAVAAVDDRDWDVAWFAEDPDSYAGSSVTRLRATVGLRAEPVRALVLAEGEGGCEHLGDWLLVPVEVSLADPDGTFVAAGPNVLAAAGLSDDAMDFDWETGPLVVEPIPPDLAAAGDAVLAPLGTAAEDFTLVFDGRLSALDIYVQAEGGSSVAVVSQARLGAGTAGD